MKFTADLFGRRLILDADQLSLIVDAISSCEIIKSEYEKDENGKYADIKLLASLEPSDLNIAVLPDTTYDALKFITTARNANKDK